MPKGNDTTNFPYCVSLFQHCTLDLGSYIKDLSIIHGDLSSIAILDNSPAAYRSHPGKRSSYNIPAPMII